MAQEKVILVVDDQREVRMTVVRALKRAGYFVVDAADGLEALVVLHGPKGHDPVDAIVTDKDMPNMDGYMLIDKVDGRVPCILHSGDAMAYHRNAFRCVLKGRAEDIVDAVNALFTEETRRG